MWLIFIIMRSDAKSFSPFREVDPIFTDAVIKAKQEGVNVIACKFSVGVDINYLGEIEVILPPPKFKDYWPAL